MKIKMHVINAEAEMADPASLYHTLKGLISLRKVHPALQSTAGFRLLEDTYPLVYERSCEEETILVVINVSDKEKQTAQDTSGSLLWSFDHKALTGNTLPPVYTFVGGAEPFYEETKEFRNIQVIFLRLNSRQMRGTIKDIH